MRHIPLKAIVVTVALVVGGCASAPPIDIETATGPAGYWRVTKFHKDYRDWNFLWENVEILQTEEGALRWTVTDHPGEPVAWLEATGEANRYRFRRNRERCVPDGTKYGTKKCGDVLISADQKKLTLLLHESDAIHFEAKRTPWYKGWDQMRVRPGKLFGDD